MAGIDFPKQALLDNVFDFDRASQGKRWDFPRLQQEHEYESLYEADFSSLFSDAPTLENGLSIIGGAQNIIKINRFRTCTRLYVDGLFSPTPAITSDSDALRAWLNENRQQLIAQLQEAVRWLTIKGRGVLLVDSLGIQALDPSSYFPVLSRDDQTRTLGHVLSYLYYEGESEDFGVVPSANRIKFVFFGGGLNEFRVHDYQAGMIGEVLASGPADLRGVFSFGGGVTESFYQDAPPLAREVMMRRTILTKVLNRFGSPHIVGPHDAPEPFTLDPKGMLMRRSSEGHGYEYMLYDPDLRGQLAYLEGLEAALDEILVIPRVALGQAVGLGESGVARERAMFHALSRINRIRAQIEELLPGLLDAAGAPSAAVEVQWPGVVLTSYNDLVNRVVVLTQAGLLSPNEGRGWLGLSPLDDPRYDQPYPPQASLTPDGGYGRSLENRSVS